MSVSRAVQHGGGVGFPRELRALYRIFRELLPARCKAENQERSFFPFLDYLCWILLEVKKSVVVVIFICFFFVGYLCWILLNLKYAFCFFFFGSFLGYLYLVL